jgi:hypothetical protein
MQLMIKTRLWIGFGLMMALVGLGSGAGYWLAGSAADRTRPMIAANVAERVAAEEVQVALLQARQAEKDFLLRLTMRSMSTRWTRPSPRLRPGSKLSSKSPPIPPGAKME